MKIFQSRNIQPGRLLRFLILLITGLVISLFFAQKVNFPASDLGRHIKNGETFLLEPSALSTNYYSFTEPAYPVVTHHWGAGVIYYWIYSLTGYPGLTLFNIILALLAIYFFYLSARLFAPFWLSLLMVIVAIPLLTHRVEIRPEMFSYLFFGIVLYLLLKFESGRLHRKALLIILPLQLLWVNLHIFFVFGFILTGVFLLHNLILKRKRNDSSFLGWILGLSVLLSMASPYGLKGLLEPFMIFREYGYMIAENQTLIFMQKRFPAHDTYLYFEMLFMLGIPFIILLLTRRRATIIYPLLLLYTFFVVFGIVMVRGIAFYGYFIIPFGAIMINSLYSSIDQRHKKILRVSAGIVTLVILILFLSRTPLFYPRTQTMGLGLLPGSNQSAEFFRALRLKGPIFNNYDIGSYLIYHLFPDHRVFTDNRPEAYSVEFFTDIYVKMQEDEEVWKEMIKKFNFNVIYFYRHDNTPWGQSFLIRRIKDPDWAPVFVDAYTLILLKRKPENTPVISHYELPQEIFTVEEY